MIIETIARGKPAAFGHEIVKRRFRLTAERVSLENKNVLDLGCGNGSQTCEFINAGCRIAAVDIGFENLAVLAKHLRDDERRAIIPVQYDGLHLPFAGGSIELVVSYEVLEHVQDEAATLCEIYRVLKPGGEFILSVPNKGWIFETHGARLPLLPWNRVPFFSYLPHRIHRRFAKARIYRKRDIINLLIAHSFEILSAPYITAPMDVVKNAQLKRLLRGTLFRGDTTRWTFLATAILVHARRR